MTADSSAQSMVLPLAGLRVLENGSAAGGPIGRYLCELGADVIFVPAGPWDHDEPATLVGNTGKRLMHLDPALEADQTRFAELASEADILILTKLESANPDTVGGGALAEIRRRNPRIVILQVSPFGRDNVFEKWEATSSVIDALSGVLSRSGFPERAPLLPPADISLQCAYVQAAWVALLAYFNRLRTGHGDLIDLSLVQAATQALDPGFGIAGSATAGVVASQLQRGRLEARHLYPILPCKDGHVRICVLAPRQWQGMFEWMGRPEKYAAPEFNTLRARFTSPTLLKDIAALFAGKARAELEKEGVRHGVPIAPLLSLAEATAMEQFVARRAIVRVQDGKGDTVAVPNGVVEIDGVRAGTTGLASDLPLDVGWRDPERFDPAPEAKTPPRPLSGYTVLDFGVIVAGGEQARLLADQGARTLKLENRAFPDGGRQTLSGEPISLSVAMGHRNKQGVGINLRDERGRALLLDLVRRADVVLSNFKPGTLESLNLGHAELSAANPGIIIGESSAYGPTGPWRVRPGYGPLVRASSGVSQLWAYPDGAFSDGVTVYPDHVSGRIVALATVALLIRRMRLGCGGAISLAQSEAVTAHLAERIAASSLGIDQPLRPDAPWGVYPCAGDDEWCVITVRCDSDWQVLCGVIERLDLAIRPDLASAGQRLGAKDELDAILSSWTKKRTPDDVMETLQSAGVPAAKMLRVFELPDFRFFQERGAFKRARHPLIDDEFYMENSIGNSERIRDPEFLPAPLPGEHSEAIATEILCLDATDIRELFEIGVLEMSEK